MTLYLPSPDDEPPMDSIFAHHQRDDPTVEADDPQMVYVWAQAVVRQVAQYREAARRYETLLRYDERVQPVPSDSLLQAWGEERVALHFLLEAGVRMLRWASLPADPDGEAEQCEHCKQWKRAPGSPWLARTLLYEVPEMSETHWVSKLRNVLTHHDDKARNPEQLEQARRQVAKVAPDIEQLDRTARALIQRLTDQDDWNADVMSDR